MTRTDVEQRLLDSAEALFSESGYSGISVREITDHAGTRLAAISERFGGKEGLFRAVILRRIRPLNDDRRARLATLPLRGSRNSRLRALVEAFCMPMRERTGDPGWDNYFRLIAQLANSGHPIRALISEEFNAIAGEFVGALRDLFPTATEPAVYDAYLHLVAATLHTYSNNFRLDSLTQGRLHTRDVDERHEALVRFAVGGITSVAAP
jgi:AcrR family transcriptional regulator